MKRYKGFFCLAVFVFLLSSCTHSVEKLTKDEKLRREILNDCKQMLESERNDNQNCKNAADAEVLALRNKVKSLFK